MRISLLASIVPFLLACLVAAGCNRLFPGKPAPAPTSSATAPSGAGTTSGGSATTPAEGLYADLQEDVLTAEQAGASNPLRPRKGDTVFELSNPRITAPTRRGPFPAPPRPGSGQVLAVDYRKVSEGPYNGGALIIRTAGGKDHTVQLFGGLNDRAGTIELEVAFRGPWTGALPKDAELYMVRTETRYGVDFHKTFKVSNSVVLGKTDFPLTLARNWTAEEAAKLRTPPPEGPKTSPVNPGIGEDTAMLGTPEPHKFKRWTVDGGKPVVGFDWRTARWDNEDCLAALTPIFDRQFPNTGQQRVMAKPGYAVGGLTLKSKTFINGVRVTFMKVTPDGKLDPSDKYESPWLGPHTVGVKEGKLGGDGRAVVGLITDQAAVLHAVGLVVE